MTPSRNFDPAAWQPEITLERFTLANGLTLFVLPDHRLPIVSLQIHYKVGSRHELPGITGISHLFEHLMFRGTETLGPEEFSRILQAKGGEINAFTTKDHTSYFENLPAEHLELGLQAGGRPPDQPQTGRRHLPAGAPGGHQRTEAPLRGQPLRAGGRAIVRHRLHPAPLRLAGGGLGPGPAPHDPGRLPGLLPQPLPTRQDHRGHRRRRGAEAGPGPGGPVFRPDTRPGRGPRSPKSRSRPSGASAGPSSRRSPRWRPCLPGFISWAWTTRISTP